MITNEKYTAIPNLNKILTINKKKKNNKNNNIGNNYNRIIRVA